MDKNKILQFVAQLQELRDNVEDFMYFSTIPVEHLEINFNEGMDRAVEAVLFLYGEIVLDEIQRKKYQTNITARQAAGLFLSFFSPLILFTIAIKYYNYGI